MPTKEQFLAEKWVDIPTKLTHETADRFFKQVGINCWDTEAYLSTMQRVEWKDMKTVIDDRINTYLTKWI